MKAHPHQDTIFRYFRKVETSGRFYKHPVKMGNGPPKKDQCYSAARKKEILPLVITCVDLEDTMLGEINQTENITYMCRLL